MGVFYDNGYYLGGAQLRGGAASFTTNSLWASTHASPRNYSGDASSGIQLDPLSITVNGGGGMGGGHDMAMDSVNPVSQMRLGWIGTPPESTQALPGKADPFAWIVRRSRFCFINQSSLAQGRTDHQTMGVAITLDFFQKSHDHGINTDCATNA